MYNILYQRHYACLTTVPMVVVVKCIILCRGSYSKIVNELPAAYVASKYRNAERKDFEK